MTHHTSSRFAVRLVLLAGFVGSFPLLLDAAGAEDAAVPDPAPNAQVVGPEGEPATLTIYPLEHVQGELLVQLARMAIPDARFTVDPAHRRLIVYAVPSDHERVAELLKRIDTPPDGGGEQLKVFQLAHSDVQSVLGAIGVIAPDAQIAVDQRTNSLLAKGSDDSLRMIAAVLERLDERPAPGLPEETFRLRIVWFTAGASDRAAVRPDDDLQAVAEELSNVCAGSMVPTGQTLVSAVPGGKFQIRCSTEFGDGPADLEIRGQLDVAQLKIEISAVREEAVAEGERKSSSRRVRLVDLATEITAPLRHFVVLGITPMGQETLAFAVQILPTE